LTGKIDFVSGVNRARRAGPLSRPKGARRTVGTRRRGQFGFAEDGGAYLYGGVTNRTRGNSDAALVGLAALVGALPYQFKQGSG